MLSTTYGPIGLRGQERNAAEEEAIKAYDKAIQIDPNYTDAWICKGFILLRIATRNSTIDLNKCNESLNSFDKALELNPKDTNAWQGGGTLLLSLNKVEEAIESYDKALENDPSNLGASQGKAQALAALGRKNESAKAYDKSLETVDREIKVANSPENLSQAWLSKGIVLQEQGRNEDAIKALDNAINADPMNEMAWKVKGYVLSAILKKHSEAIEAFDKALQINSKDPLTWQRKGDALKALDRQDEADVAYAKAKGLGYIGPS
ncbi:MAG: tetratricopeptide repeat protein [Methanotrichaceae archaeon]